MNARCNRRRPTSSYAPFRVEKSWGHIPSSIPVAENKYKPARCHGVLLISCYSLGPTAGPEAEREAMLLQRRNFHFLQPFLTVERYASQDGRCVTS
ncbi:unnamed protein product [Lota lota]